MIIVTAPILLTDFGQPLFPLAWKAKNLGAESYVASETHVGYLINLNHSTMFDKATIQGVVGAGGDFENLPLFIEIDPAADCPLVEGMTWAEYAASINHIPSEIDGKFYIEAVKNGKTMKASEVITLSLPWLTTVEFQVILPQGEI
jgi:hypothetical protein